MLKITWKGHIDNQIDKGREQLVWLGSIFQPKIQSTYASCCHLSHWMHMPCISALLKQFLKWNALGMFVRPTLLKGLWFKYLTLLNFWYHITKIRQACVQSHCNRHTLLTNLFSVNNWSDITVVQLERTYVALTRRWYETFHLWINLWKLFSF